MTLSAPDLESEIRPLHRVEYDRLVEAGLLEGEKVELLYGRIVRKAPQGDHHSGSLEALGAILFAALLGRARVRIQMPFVAPSESEPEPDLAVVPPGDPFGGHPSVAHLIVEIAATSQRKDRGPKGALYAAAGVPEFWLVDVAARRVERYRRPLDGRFAESSLHGPEETLALLAFPDATVELAKILPPAR